MTSSTSLLSSFEDTARSVSAAVGPSTVGVGRHGRGSGVVIGAGKVLTNAHNLRDRTTQVTFADGRSTQGSVAGIDPHGDLVVLDVDTADVEPIEWADELPDTGSIVFAISRSSRGSRISFGLVSGTGRGFRGPGGRPIAGSLEHTAPLGRGSSGGPLVDTSGRLVGLNTHRLGEGFYLALPADTATRRRIDRLSAGESAAPLTLGIVITPAEVARRMRRAVGLEDRDGLLIRGIEEGAPASRAGLREGDLIVGTAGTTITTTDDLFGVLAGHEPGAPLDVAIVRGNDDLTVAVSFVDPEPADASETSSASAEPEG